MQYWWLNKFIPIDFSKSEGTPCDCDWPQPAIQQAFPWTFDNNDNKYWYIINKLFWNKNEIVKKTKQNDKGLPPVIFFFDENCPLSGYFDSLWVGEYESRKKIGGLYGFFV